jgi:hypothetical protein
MYETTSSFCLFTQSQHLSDCFQLITVKALVSFLFFLRKGILFWDPYKNFRGNLECFLFPKVTQNKCWLNVSKWAPGSWHSYTHLFSEHFFYSRYKIFSWNFQVELLSQASSAKLWQNKFMLLLLYGHELYSATWANEREHASNSPEVMLSWKHEELFSHSLSSLSSSLLIFNSNKKVSFLKAPEQLTMLRNHMARDLTFFTMKCFHNCKMDLKINKSVILAVEQRKNTGSLLPTLSSYKVDLHTLDSKSWKAFLILTAKSNEVCLHVRFNFIEFFTYSTFDFLERFNANLDAKDK